MREIVISNWLIVTLKALTSFCLFSYIYLCVFIIVSLCELVSMYCNCLSNYWLLTFSVFSLLLWIIDEEIIMSVKLSSKQFKQDINSLFIKLHSILTGLEAKIIERDESLREEVKQEWVFIWIKFMLIVNLIFLIRILANLILKDDNYKDNKPKDAKVADTKADNPVSMVVPVDPNQFIGTTIKHTSSYISDQTINLTIRAGVSNNNLNKSTSNCHNSTGSTIKNNTNTNTSTTSTATATSTATGNATTTSTCNTNNIVKIHSNSNNGNSNSNSNTSFNMSNDNEGHSSRQDCDSQDEPFKTINNSIGNNFTNNNSVSVPSSSASPSTANKEVNNRVKENRCPMCAQRFTQLNSLKRHIRSHTGERPFPCGYCEKRFVDRERLKVHVRIHTGEKPFSCNLCSRRFSQKSTVKRHMSVHTGLKPFQCSSCSKRFGTRDNLRVHEKSHFQVDTKFKNINSNQVQSDNMDYLWLSQWVDNWFSTVDHTAQIDKWFSSFHFRVD